MKCPLFGDHYEATLHSGIERFTECLKEECAWWDSADDQCLMVTIPDELNRIGSALQKIEQKMEGK